MYVCVKMYILYEECVCEDECVRVTVFSSFLSWHTNNRDLWPTFLESEFMCRHSSSARAV